MAQNRTYIVKMPGSQDAITYVDITVMGPVGTQAAPVSSAVGGTPPPVGWNGGASAAAFYEWRGRPLRIPVLAAPTSLATPSGVNSGFVPRLRLGWRLALQELAPSGISADFPAIVPSVSLGSFAGGPAGAIIPVTPLLDPTYGPVLRVFSSVALANKVYAIHFSVFEQKDEDRDPLGL
jgi:hypothetical protein